MAFSGQRLAEARVAAGLTQQQLARALGVDKARISEWERGQSTPRASRLPDVAHAVGVDPLQLAAAGYEQLDLEALRLAAGLSRQALAAKVGTTLTRYQRLEAGGRAGELPDALLRALARALAVPEVTIRSAVQVSRDQAMSRRQEETLG